MPLTYERVTDEAGARTLCAIDEAAMAIDHPALVADQVQDVMGLLPDGTPSERIEMEVVFDGADAVASTFVLFQLRDNTHTSDGHVTVLPDARRQGIGRAVAERLLERIRAEGRKVVVDFIGAPFGATPPGAGLAKSLGAIPALESICRSLDARALDDALLDAMVARNVGDHAGGYEVVQWLDHAPDDLAEGAAAILPHVFSDSPRGELDFEDEVWDVPRFREYEETVQRRGRCLLVTGAVDRGTGRLVAYTEITVPRARREFAWQWGTIVEHEHRGHRLGFLVKAENLRQLRQGIPEAATVATWNAAENAHMIAVNEELGFRPIERYQAWQLTL